MKKAYALTVLLLLTAGVVAQQAPPASPAGAGTTAAVVQTPVLSPADSMKTFTVAPGYHVELVASEPIIQDPVVIDFDPRRPAVGGRDDRLHERPLPRRTSISRSDASWFSRTRTTTGRWTSGRSLPRGWCCRAR